MTSSASFSRYFLAAALLMGQSAILTASPARAGQKTVKAAEPASDGEEAGPGDGTMDPGAAAAGSGEGSDGPQSRPAPPTSGPPAPVTFTAYLSEGSPALIADVTWRVFEGHGNEEGSYKLLKTARDARPTIDLRPGEYLVNIAYGRASLTKKIGVWPEKPVSEDFVVNAGGIRLSATLAHGPIVAEHLLKFEIFSESQDQFGTRQKILADVRPGLVIRLNSGIYHVVSTYGDGNSQIAADVVVEPGKVTEAIVDHDAGKATLKLVQRAGGEAVADTKWTVYNAAGEVVKESAGAFPTHILAAGDYRVAAQHGEEQYAGGFSIAAGDNKLVEVLMQ